MRCIVLLANKLKSFSSIATNDCISIEDKHTNEDQCVMMTETITMEEDDDDDDNNFLIVKYL